MSKSKRNVVTPDAMAEKYGADSLRIYELFVAPFEDAIQWSEEGMNGAYRFLGRVWRLVDDYAPRFDAGWAAGVAEEAKASERARALRRKTHQTIRKVGQDIEDFAFNTAVAALMELVNEMSAFARSLGPDGRSPAMSEAIENLLLLLGPMAPHIADELWERIGKTGFTHNACWPAYDEEVAREERITVVVQVNGKVRDRLEVPAGTPAPELERLALESERVKAQLDEKKVRKVIVVPDRLVNVVVG